MGNKLNFTDCLGFCIGQIVGSGIFVLTGIVMGLTGHGMPYAFILAAIISLLQLIPMAIMGSAMPATGGSYVYAKRLIGPRAGFVYLMIFVLSQVLIATFALGFADYVQVIFPGVSTKVVATLAILAAAGVNIIGLKTSAVVQKGMVALLLISLGVYIVFGLPRVSWEMLTPTIDNLMPNGFLSFLQGATMLSFACGGAKFLAENGGEVENPGKTIPRAMVVSTLIVAVFYALVGVVAAGVLPLDQVAGQNISVVAKDVFPAPVYLFFVIGGAWFALLTTLNGTLSWVTRGLQRASFDGWLPKSWGKETKSGAPIYLLGFFVVVGLIPVLTGMDTTDIANMGTGCSKLSDLLMVYACFRLPDVLPEVYEKSTLKMAPGKLKAVMVLVFLVLGGTSAVSLSSLTGGQFLGMGVFIVIAIIVMLLRQKHFKDADNFKANSKA
ncbi:MAG TPA: APC family permease [Candidatus Anaerotruncus excrementipullorum]|uniref:APC family permease n=1 Tax=Candidatus Anaerotruncus excrementipullorum TaxID=2838465 RepID=A0A9D2B737_9FIRM|nr:APC family permease [Candidatus Anaerotruncus excrementipullorum]